MRGREGESSGGMFFSFLGTKGKKRQLNPLLFSMYEVENHTLFFPKTGRIMATLFLLPTPRLNFTCSRHPPAFFFTSSLPNNNERFFNEVLLFFPPP